jgi:hypothetical protein
MCVVGHAAKSDKPEQDLLAMLQILLPAANSVQKVRVLQTHNSFKGKIATCIMDRRLSYNVENDRLDNL